MGKKTKVKFVIYGEPASKANSRRAVVIKKRPAFIKSEKALNYQESALQQIPENARLRMSCNVKVTIRIYYASLRPDLDESLILDILQDRYIGGRKKKNRILVQPGVYKNDRQVKRKFVIHDIDRDNPRAEITVREL